MELLSDWFKANQLSLNMSKTIAMPFWDNKKNLSITLDDQKIPLVETTKFLGITLDSDLSCSHITYLYNKLQANKHLLSMSLKILTTSNLKLLYYTHIYSHLVYGIGVWGSMANNTQIKKQIAIQKACVRLVARKKKNHPTNELFQDLQIVNITDMIKIETAKVGHRITTEQYPTPLLNIFNAHGGLKQHRYPTRNKRTPNIQLNSGQQLNNHLLCESFSIYSHLPAKLKKIHKD